LWDPDYKDESWINDKIMLIPRMKAWVAKYYPGTKIGITEYSWGAERHISGAIAQVDVLGIFGREGLDLATRWTCPPTGSLAFNAIRMYRNYDGKNGSFGDTSVRCQAPDPDTVAAFASVDTMTRELKVMLINKQLHEAADVAVAIQGFAPSGTVHLYRLTSSNSIDRLEDIAAHGSSLALSLPAQSITLAILPGR